MGNTCTNIKIKSQELIIKPQELIIEPIQNEDFVNYLNTIWDSDKDNIRELNDLPYQNEINEEDLKLFQDKVETNFKNLKVVGNFNYLEIMEKETRISKKDIGIDNLKMSYLALKDLELNNQINNNLMDKSLKLIDRLWCLKVYNIVKSLDVNIFKSTLFEGMNASVIITAIKNTESRENVVLIDLEKAFDSCDYDIIQLLLYRNFCRRTDESKAKKLTLEYMYIIRQRRLYYNDKIINFKKGIPTGLPSSNIIFSLIMDEIINEWLIENNERFKINIDFILNIFVDDVYLKINNHLIKDILVKSLIDKITQYKFKVNVEKCKADEHLKLDNFSKLEESDYYLGIPFIRDSNKYCDLILKKYNHLKNSNYTYKQLYDKIKNNDPDKKLIYGHFNYKLKPFMGDDDLLTYLEKVDK